MQDLPQNLQAIYFIKTMRKHFFFIAFQMNMIFKVTDAASIVSKTSKKGVSVGEGSEATD